MPTEQSLQSKLDKRKQENAFRDLRSNKNLIDFSSNDYLGFANDFEFLSHADGVGGSTGSRLLTGNSKEAEDLEKYIATFHHAESGLIFNSGYDANLGLLSCVPQRGDTVQVGGQTFVQPTEPKEPIPESVKAGRDDDLSF